MIAIKIENLSKSYSVGFFNTKIKVLENINLNVEENTTFGLLGPNGAGKTTTLKILVGLLKPSSGKVLILDRSPNNISVKEQIGYLPENPYVYIYLTGLEFLNLAASLYFQNAQYRQRRIRDVLDIVGLSNFDINKQIKTYSKGMLQRLCFAQSILNDPQIIFLDEPMSGLDPIGRYEFKNIILTLKEQGKTIFFNSHILSDVEEICDSIAIMYKGKILKAGKIQDLAESVPNIYELVATNLNIVGQNNLKRISLKLVTKGKEVRGTFHDIDNAMKAMTIVKQSGGKILSLGPYKASLEQLFIETIEAVKGGHT